MQVLRFAQHDNRTTSLRGPTTVLRRFAQDDTLRFALADNPALAPTDFRFISNSLSVSDVERLFTTYHQPLVRYLTRRLGDRDWAEEVAQEVLLEVWRMAPRYDAAKGSARAWISTMAPCGRS